MVFVELDFENSRDTERTYNISLKPVNIFLKPI